MYRNIETDPVSIHLNTREYIGHFGQAAVAAAVQRCEDVQSSRFGRICIPISAFADNLDFKVVNPTGGGDRVGGSHRCCILVVLPMTCRSIKTISSGREPRRHAGLLQVAVSRVNLDVAPGRYSVYRYDGAGRFRGTLNTDKTGLQPGHKRENNSFL